MLAVNSINTIINKDTFGQSGFDGVKFGQRSVARPGGQGVVHLVRGGFGGVGYQISSAGKIEPIA